MCGFADQIISKPAARKRVTPTNATARPIAMATNIAPPNAATGTSLPAVPNVTKPAAAIATWKVVRVG
jgi:hypothetical protein